MVLITGNQLRAARALAGVEQKWLADKSGVSINTVRNMEGRGAGEITSGAVTVRKVQSALEAAGVEFTNGRQPGVKLRADPFVTMLKDGTFQVCVPVVGHILPHKLPNEFHSDTEAERWISSSEGIELIGRVMAKYRDRPA